jgi:CBS domain-containing protein
MQANYIMTRDVITASPNTSISELIRLMLENRVSGIPVIDNGTVVGIVTEGDLLRRMEIGTERRPSHWRELLDSSSRLAADYVKMYGRKASDVMTPNVITVIEMASLAEIAAILESHRIKRVPVLREGKLVGIVSRANLLQALASRLAMGGTVDDRRIRDSVLAELRAQPWGGSPTVSNVIVQDGVVHLWGFIDSPEQRQARIVAAENTAGVRSVEDHMEYWTEPSPDRRFAPLSALAR